MKEFILDIDDVEVVLESLYHFKLGLELEFDEPDLLSRYKRLIALIERMEHETGI